MGIVNYTCGVGCFRAEEEWRMVHSTAKVSVHVCGSSRFLERFCVRMFVAQHSSHVQLLRNDRFVVGHSMFFASPDLSACALSHCAVNTLVETALQERQFLENR